MSWIARLAEWLMNQDGGFKPGDLVSVQTDDGNFGVAKILTTDSMGVHVRLYVQRFDRRPPRLDPTQLDIAPFGPGFENPFSIGHMPLRRQSFLSWRPQPLARGHPVSEEELEGYQMWLEAGGGYF